ncbi:MAG: PrgI family protein [Candidatus Taylorbacteria bacterium]|nr:PrgI family protein [Candidatus Taylorbacteria bacterium]
MQYQVPQFIEIEDKIFGPLTLKQFIYLAGGAGLCYMVFRFLPLFLAIFIIPLLAGFAVALAFYKINGKPFITIVEAAARFVFSEKLYIWRKQSARPKTKPAPALPEDKEEASFVPKLSNSKLRELSWSLDIKTKK